MFRNVQHRLQLHLRHRRQWLMASGYDLLRENAELRKMTNSSRAEQRRAMRCFFRACVHACVCVCVSLCACVCVCVREVGNFRQTLLRYQLHVLMLYQGKNISDASIGACAREGALPHCSPTALN